MNNTIKTIILFGSLTALLILLGNFFGGQKGLIIMTLFSVLINFFVYFFSDKIAIRSARAVPLDEQKYNAVFQLIQELTQRAEIPEPKLYLSPNQQPNAFATGRNPAHSAIVVTEGLIRSLEREELKGVLAHEISHIKNRDILISTAAAVIASLITAVVRWGVWFSGDSDNRNPILEILMFIMAPIAAFIIQMAISRSREFKADETGAKLAGDPTGLANALEKIENISSKTPAPNINPAFENLYISNPLGGGTVSGMIQKLFSTHPPITERVEKLKNWSYDK